MGDTDRRMPTRPTRRDRRGRGLRGIMAQAPVPIAHSRSERFDELVLQAVERLQPRLAPRLDSVEFAVEDVPDLPQGDPAYDSDVIDDAGVPLSRIHRDGIAGIPGPVVVVFRRPVESRARRPDDLADLIREIVVEQLARVLDMDPEDIDPTG